ncbi:MAG: hypothetical protein OEW17_06230 [Gemmatimonadota bacterium]|nr:hypothetical protein [Gemmatimonadota bacterium]
MREPWESNDREMQWTDSEAWRGEQHPETPDNWRTDAGEGWVWADEDEMGGTEAEESPGWPENLAGPEYWMYRRLGG